MSDPNFNFTLPAGWEELTAGKGRAVRKVGHTNSVLQMSFQLNRTHKPLVAPPSKTILAGKLALRQGGKITHTDEGTFPLGTYGRAIFTGERLAHGEVWVLMDGVHTFLATYTSEKQPDRQELQEVASIITSAKWEK